MNLTMTCIHIVSRPVFVRYATIVRHVCQWFGIVVSHAIVFAECDYLRADRNLPLWNFGCNEMLREYRSGYRWCKMIRRNRRKRPVSHCFACPDDVLAMTVRYDRLAAVTRTSYSASRPVERRRRVASPSQTSLRYASYPMVKRLLRVFRVFPSVQSRTGVTR